MFYYRVISCLCMRLNRAMTEVPSCVTCADLATGEQDSMEGLSTNLGSELTRRDLNNVLTTVCCKVGCRKSELAFLC